MIKLSIEQLETLLNDAMMDLIDHPYIAANLTAGYRYRLADSAGDVVSNVLKKYKELEVGDYIVKSNKTIFGSGENKTPAIKIETLQISNDFHGKLYIINNKFHTRRLAVNIVSKQRADELWEKWNTIKLSDANPDNLLTSCVRESTGKEKVKLTESTYKKALFEMQLKHPDKVYEAYKCSHCNEIHVGKVNEELA